MSAVDTLNVATRDYIDKNAKKLVDTVFQSSQLAKQLRGKARKFPGGTKITEHIVYAGSGGGGHKRGKRYVNAERQTDQRLQFDPKFMRIPVVLDQIDIRVINQGPFKVYDILESKLSNAYLTLGSYMEIALYLAGSGNSYAANINGLAEITNDNSETSFDGASYSTYGELDRTNPNWGTRVKGNVENINGAITYETLERTYMKVKFGGIEPTLGQTTPKAVSYMKNRIFSQQRWNDTQDGTFGFNGVRFNRARIIDSRYCPGTEINSDPLAADYVTFTTEDEATPLTAYPTVAGETLFWLNTDDEFMHLYISSDKIWGMGFSDFIPSAESDMLVGAIRLAWQLTAPGTRYHYQLRNITG
jgi:hypothetical protein